LIREQITGENFITHSYVTLLLELVLASATGATVMCPPPDSLHAGHQVGMYQEFSSTLNILEIFYNFILFFYILLIITISLLVSMFFCSGIYIW